MHNSDKQSKVNGIISQTAIAATYLMAVGVAFTLALNAGLRLLEG